MVQVVVSDEKMLDALREVARENSDRVYVLPANASDDVSLCFYVHHDAETREKSPGCLIAHALVKVGVSLDALASWEGTSASVVASSLVSGLHYDTLAVLGRAQDAQDNGATWSDALNHAELRPSGVEF